MHSGELTDGTLIVSFLLGPLRVEAGRADDLGDALLADLLLNPLKRHERQLAGNVGQSQPLDAPAQELRP